MTDEVPLPADGQGQGDTLPIPTLNGTKIGEDMTATKQDDVIADASPKDLSSPLPAGEDPSKPEEEGITTTTIATTTADAATETSTTNNNMYQHTEAAAESSNISTIPKPYSTVRRLLHKFVTRVGPQIIGNSAAQGGGWFTSFFGSSTRDVRLRQCALSLERLGNALVHVGEDHQNSINEDWDERHCTELVSLFVDVLCTWTGLSVVSSNGNKSNGEVNGGTVNGGTSTEGGSDGVVLAYVDPEAEAEAIHQMGVEPQQLAQCIDCAQELVAHGCMDGISIRVTIRQTVDENGRKAGGAGVFPKSMMADDSSPSKKKKKKKADTLLQHAAHATAAQQQQKVSKDQAKVKVVFKTLEMKAVDRIADAVFSADLSSEMVELSALKFLLTAGCRTSMVKTGNNGTEVQGDALLRGNRLLRSVRVLYHVFLRTASLPNRTTARAALEQIVAAVFARMEQRRPSSLDMALCKMNGEDEKKENIASRGKAVYSLHSRYVYAGVWESLAYKPVISEAEREAEATLKRQEEFDNSFPTLNHRDAFMLFRSLCKLAMKSSPNEMRVPVAEDANLKDEVSDDRIYITEEGEANGAGGLESLPALQSKMVSLELLLSVLDDPGRELILCDRFAYAVRQFLCVALLKNFTSSVTRVVGLSLRLFVPIIRHFREGLKTELEAFVTNVFFVILDSPNSNVEHKSLVVTLFKEICSDPSTLAEIFLNYDCDLSAVDLFHRIVSSLARTAKGTHFLEDDPNSPLIMAGTGAEKLASARQAERSLRLNAMKALRQILASLHASMAVVVETDVPKTRSFPPQVNINGHGTNGMLPADLLEDMNGVSGDNNFKTHHKSEQAADVNSPSLVEIYDSKQKLKEEIIEITLRFNQKPSAGVKYAGQCGHIQADDPISVAKFLLDNQGRFEKTQIGELLGREVDYQNGFYLRVLQAYVRSFTFNDLSLDESIRLFLAGFRLPGEAQKIDRIMETFAERYCLQNPDVFPTADAAFILSFSIIMLNTDLHNPAIKPERRMTKDGFIRNNRGICNGQDLPSEMLTAIFDRIKIDQISLKEDDEAREKVEKETTGKGMPAFASPGVLFGSHLDEMNRKKASNFLAETDKMLRTTESLLKKKKRKSSVSTKTKFVRTKDSGLRDEYVSPMFEVTWGAALAVFSTALESANGTAGASTQAEATEAERFAMNRNAVATTEVCLSGFRTAICVAGLCGHEIARNAFVNALANFTQLGCGRLLEHRHIRCTQTLLRLAREDGECLGSSWEKVFSILSEVARLRRLLDVLARYNKQSNIPDIVSDDDDESAGESYLTDDEGDIDEVSLDEDMDRRSIDEANANAIREAISEDMIDSIYSRSSLLSDASAKEFIYQLCRVSQTEISGYGASTNGVHNSMKTGNFEEVTHLHLLPRNTVNSPARHQPVIYSLQRLVEVAHYNMDTRLLCVWGEIWSNVSSHLINTALQSNEAVAIYAVDSLRQLSIQYLQRKELGVFEFQRRFLKPYEVIMAQCKFVSPRELLLKGIEQILLVCGGGGTDSTTRTNNTLRSGWRPILNVLGYAAHDTEEYIAKMGFDMLNGLLDGLKKAVSSACLSLSVIGKVGHKEEGNDYSHCHGFLMTEHFVDLVESLVKYISCPYDDLSKKGLAYLVMMSDWLGNDKNPTPQVKKRRSKSLEHVGEDIEVVPAKSNELELWWPLLLGFSRTVADKRKETRSNALVILMKVINRDFIKIGDGEDMTEDDIKGDLITLQLIFRGILHPILDYADVSDYQVRTSAYLPKDFTFLISPTKMSPSKKAAVGAKTAESNYWVETTFDLWVDGCISLCNRTSDYFRSNVFVEEIMSIIRACLQADSWIVRVRGLRRLQDFLDKDTLGRLSNSTIDSIAGMLYRCLTLPLSYNSDEDVVRLNVQRYSGSNVVSVTAKLLVGAKHSQTISPSWKLRLADGLANYIHNWENVAKLPEFSEEDQVLTMFTPPHPLENAMYGRKLMMKTVLTLASTDGFLSDEEASSAQDLVVNQTHAVLTAFLEKETAMSDEPRDPVKEACQIVELGHMTALVCDLLDGYSTLSDAHFFSLTWLRPMLSTLIESNTKSVRTSVQNLVARAFEGLPKDVLPVSPFRKV